MLNLASLSFNVSILIMQTGAEATAANCGWERRRWLWVQVRAPGAADARHGALQWLRAPEESLGKPQFAGNKDNSAESCAHLTLRPPRHEGLQCRRQRKVRLSPGGRPLQRRRRRGCEVVCRFHCGLLSAPDESNAQGCPRRACEGHACGRTCDGARARRSTARVILLRPATQAV